jgi:hypothetical protein
MGTARAELYEQAEAYLDALAAHDPSRLRWTDDAAFSENNVRLAIGDGLWNTISARRRGYDLKAADQASGEVSWFGIVEEHGVPAIMALRLRMVGDAIAEAETIVCRKVDLSPFPGIVTYVEPRPLMLADVPAERRRSRDELVRIADGYFDTLQMNDGTLHTEFTDDCERIENGVQTTNNAAAFGDYPIAGLGCAEQFRKGHFRFDDRLRDRR